MSLYLKFETNINQTFVETQQNTIKTIKIFCFPLLPAKKNEVLKGHKSVLTLFSAWSKIESARNMFSQEFQHSFSFVRFM